MAQDVQKVIEHIKHALSKDSWDEGRLLSQIHTIARESGDIFYPAFLHVLTHLDFTEEEAQEHWNRILAHRDEMSRRMGRPMSFRVALIDYFLQINRKIENPKIIEIEMFEAIVHLTHIDPLTGLYNRRFLDQSLKREISLSNRLKCPFSIILVDLDFFKTYNDAYGHLAGDDALRLIALHLRDMLRVEDLAIRYGGEEFLLILPRVSRSGALIIGERIRKQISSLHTHTPHSNLRGPLTISGGIAAFPQDGQDETQLLQSADQALYQAKGEGRNTMCFCAPDRRRFLRIDCICSTTYQVLDCPTKAGGPATTRNMSLGGILLAVQREIPLHALVKVEINAPESHGNVSIIGEVVRIEEGIRPNEPYLVGLSFLQFEGPDQHPIIYYIKGKTQAS